MPVAPRQQRPHHLGGSLRGELELLEQAIAGGGGAEALHREHRARIGGVPLPAERRPGLDAQADADRRRQDLVAVGLGLRLEQLPRGQRHDAHPHPVGLEQARGSEGHVHLGAGGDQDRLRVAARRVEQHVPAPAHAGGRAERAAVQHRKFLAG